MRTARKVAAGPSARPRRTRRSSGRTSCSLLSANNSTLCHLAKSSASSFRLSSRATLSHFGTAPRPMLISWPLSRPRWRAFWKSTQRPCIWSTKTSRRPWLRPRRRESSSRATIGSVVVVGAGAAVAAVAETLAPHRLILRMVSPKFD